VRKFVADRGGSLLMLGGADSLDSGGSLNTPLAEVLPVYLTARHSQAPALPVRVDLTREGMRQSWLRLRAHERDESARLAKMPGYFVAHGLDALKPGAQSLATLTDSQGKIFPAIATQRFGQGRCTAFLIGDWWRWGMLGAEQHADLDKFWRQTMRGLLSDVPRRATASALVAEDGSLDLEVAALGPDFQPAEQVSISARVRDPKGQWSRVDMLPDASRTGRFQARIRSKLSGSWLAEAIVTDARDGKEFHAVKPDRAAISALVAKTGGRVVGREELPSLVKELKNRPQPVMETKSEPLWHQPMWLTLAIACFVGEWGLRRWKGLA
jgi:hypothetical protein